MHIHPRRISQSLHQMFTCQSLENIFSCSLKRKIFHQINPILFDVSLRDGIQNASPEKYDFNVKKDVFRSIMAHKCPQKIEVGSIVSPRVLPIMADTTDIYKYAKDYIDNNLQSENELYVLVPNETYLDIALQQNITNFSFITSVSNAFQMKNTRFSLDQTKTKLATMQKMLTDTNEPHSTKLYVSCINECPVFGKIDNDFIIYELLNYHTKFEFDEICLSDTMGNLSFEDFEYIVSTIFHFGFPKSKLSIHLHTTGSNYYEIKQILYYCFDHNINKFDVSVLNDGGCSVTMHRGIPNLSYELFYEIVERYIHKELS